MSNIKSDKIAIIGSGAISLAVQYSLEVFDAGSKIDVYDIGSKTEQEISSRSLGMKSYYGSFFPYDVDDRKLKHISMIPVVWPSKNPGGFTQIWGAALGTKPIHPLFNEILSIDPMDANPAAMTKSGTFLNKNLQNVRSSHTLRQWNLEVHNLAVDKNLCISCGECLAGCPTKAIWSASNLSVINPKTSYLPNHEIVRIFKHNEGIKLVFLNGEISEAYNRVFLCAGAIGTSKILQNSGFLPKTVHLQDSQTIFVPILRKRVKDNELKFSLSQASANFKDSEGNLAHIQFYPDVRTLHERLRMIHPILGRIAEPIWKIISKYSLAGVLYLDTHHSGKLALTLTDDNHFEIKSEMTYNKKKAQEKYIKKIFKEMKSLRMLPIRNLTRIGEIGEGYHFGDIDELELIPGTKELKNSLNLYAMDSSSMKGIQPGPITNRAMLEASREIGRIYG